MELEIHKMNEIGVSRQKEIKSPFEIWPPLKKGIEY